MHTRILMVIVLLWAGGRSATARADGDPAPPPAPAASDPSIGRAANDAGRSRFGLNVALGGSFDNSAVAGAIGGRLRLGRHWMLGLDGEWNPWIAVHQRSMHAGVINVYASGILRFPLLRQLAIRSTAKVGFSTLLFDLYGAPSGSVGPYVGVAPIGLEVRLSRHVTLILEPLDLAVPIPQPSGVPLIYRQYRFGLGLQFGA